VDGQVDGRIVRRINEVLRRTMRRSDIYTFRMLFTRYPEPTLSVVVWRTQKNGWQKVVEIPIDNLDDFVNSVITAYGMLKLAERSSDSTKSSTRSSSRRRAPRRD